jgi:hypothetical protein
MSIASEGFCAVACSTIASIISTGTGFGFDPCCRGGQAARPTLTATHPQRCAWSSTRHNNTWHPRTVERE